MTELKTPNRESRYFSTTRFPALLPAAFTAALWLACAGTAEARKPNIVVILTDDQGYADVSYNPHHPKEVSTPNIDKLARSSVICTAGYTSGHVCSPTRAAPGLAPRRSVVLRHRSSGGLGSAPPWRPQLGGGRVETLDGEDP